MFEYTGVEESFSYDNFEKYILNSSKNFGSLCNKIRQLELADLSIRFSAWRILLGVMSADSNDDAKKARVLEERTAYKQLVEKFKVKNVSQQQSSAELAGPLKRPNPMLNPLAKASSTASVGNTDDQELRIDIKKDVDRTYQDKPFFTNQRIKAMLTNILYYFCKKNPEVSYRQGMNEVAASFIIIYFVESSYVRQHDGSSEGASDRAREMAQFLLSPQDAEADVYSLFSRMMEIGHIEMFRPFLSESNKKKSDYNVNSKKQQAILIRISKIQDNYLKLVDLDLFKHLKLLNVEFNTFLLRWIKCVHTREYSLEDSFKLWDNIFCEYFQNPSTENDFFLIDCICLAMMQFLRTQLLDKEDQSECLQKFLKYPPVENLKPIVEVAYKIKDIILRSTMELEGSNQQSEDSKTKYKQKGPILFSTGYTDKSVETPEVVKVSKVSTKEKESEKDKSYSDLVQSKQKQEKVSDDSDEEGEDKEEDDVIAKEALRIIANAKKINPLMASAFPAVGFSNSAITSSQVPIKKSEGKKKEVVNSDEEEEVDYKIPNFESKEKVAFPKAGFGTKKKSSKQQAFVSIPEKTAAAAQAAFVATPTPTIIPQVFAPEKQQKKEVVKRIQRQSSSDSSQNNSDDDGPFKKISEPEKVKKDEVVVYEIKQAPPSSESKSVEIEKEVDNQKQVTFSANEVVSIGRKVGNTLDLLNHIYLNDIKNENLRKAIEDLQAVERDIKKKLEGQQGYEELTKSSFSSTLASNTVQASEDSNVEPKKVKSKKSTQSKPIFFSSSSSNPKQFIVSNDK